jgi:putative ABC transport system permease protein
MGLRLAIGRLVASPLFTIFSVVSLAAGVAVTTAVYSVVDTLILADSGVADPDSAALVVTPASGASARPSDMSLADYETLRQSQTSFRSITAAAAIQPSVSAGGNAEIVIAEAVEGSYFSTLGVTPRMGRLIQPADDDASARVVVISEDFWHARLAADPNAVGRTLRINGQPFEIVGVVPSGYRGLFGLLRSARLWIPLKTNVPVAAAQLKKEVSRERRLLVVGRLADGRPISAAAAELATIARRLNDSDAPAVAGNPVSPKRVWSARSIAQFTSEDSGMRRFGMTIVGLAALVLLVACTNLANLVLARGTARHGELAVRMAMGASRGRLIWEQCIESLLLAGFGAVSAVVVFQGVAALMTTDFVLGLTFGANATLSIRPAANLQAMAVAGVSLLLSLAVFGLEPAVQLARAVDIRTALANGAAGARPRMRRQRMVIRWQVAIAAGFFIVATMFIRSTLQQARHDPGVDLDRFAIAVLNFDNGIWDDARVRRAVDRVISESQSEASLSVVAASTGLPFGVPSSHATIARVGDVDGLKRQPVAAVSTTPGLFRTLGVEIVSGRQFTESDGPGAPPAVILSELTARQFFGATDAVGQPLLVRGPDGEDRLSTIVGIAADTDTRSIYTDRRPLVYLPLAQHFNRGLTISARATGSVSTAIAALRESIRRADPDLAVTASGAANNLLLGPFAIVRSLGMGALYLGALTLLLSMAGLFGVQSHVVSHRTREIGVRMSVGATASQIKLMVLKDGYRPVFEGLFLGLWGGLAGRVVVRSYLELNDVTIFDPWMLLVTPVPLLAAAFCACYLPASRAASVEPTVALRCE